MAEPIRRGSVVWVELDPVRGREQAGTRPAVVICSNAYLDAVPEVVIVLPVTTTDRGWPHHVRLAGSDLDLPHASFAMTEQPRTVSRRRVTGRAGCVDDATLTALLEWVRDFFDL